MLGAAWGWLDNKKIECISVSPQEPLNDYEVIKKLHEVLSEAECLIGHNSDSFDYKKFNTRAIYYGLPPVAPKQSIDTLKIARKYFKFSSNKLSYIANYLGLDAKNESPDWKKVIEGCPKELRYMRKYNKQDVIVTKELYLKLRAFHHNHPNINIKQTRDSAGELITLCKHCSSPELVRTGDRILKSGRARRQFRCKTCYGHTTTDLIK